MKKITLNLLCLFITGILSAGAQTITTVATGLSGPVGICKDRNGNLFVAESGSGANDGKITMIDTAGVKYTIVYGLPSYLDTATHETTGPWRPYLTADSMLRVIQGAGPDSSAGSIMEFDMRTLTPGMDSLNLADTVKIINVQKWVYGQGFMDSDIFSAVWDNYGNIYTVDAGLNAILKIDSAGNISILDTFPATPNPIGPQPPFIDYVPTKIIANHNGEFYVCNLTGFPFISGSAQLIMIDSLGNITPQLSGLTQAVDMEMDSLNNIYVLQFGLYDSTFMPIMGSASIVRIMATGAIDTLATGFGPSAGMTQDGSGGFYATELMTGNVIHIYNINKVDAIKNNAVTGLTAYPNPFNDLISFNYYLEKSSDVSYSVTDQTGKRIYFKDNGKLEKGRHSFEMDAKQFNISNLSSGIYFLSVISGESKQTISVVKK